MKCKWNDCLHEERAKSPFCSETCKKRAQRNRDILTGTESEPSGTDVPVEVGQEQVGQTTDVPVAYGLHQDFCWVGIDEMVYGRRAVKYPVDTFDTRPEPIDHSDTPDPMNRCIYRRRDGTRYLLDATGNTHERSQAA